MTEEHDSINFFEPHTIAELMPKYLKEVERRWGYFANTVTLCDMPSEPMQRLRWIGARYKQFEAAGVEPHTYFIDWLMLFTPIERAVWSSIRSCGLPMRPQYPVGPYFADFADPKRRIVIECDGREFHQNKSRDAARDDAMHRNGWIVFRLTGSECMKPDMDWQDIIDMEHDDRHEEARERIHMWLRGSGDGVVRAIQHAFYGAPIRKVSDDEVFGALISHTSASRDALRAAIDVRKGGKNG